MRHIIGSRLWDIYSYVYDPIARMFLRKSRKESIDMLIKAGGISDFGGKRLLVVGVGTGGDLKLLKSGLGLKIEAIDYSKRMLKQAQMNNVGRGDIKYRQMDANALSYADETFDIVLLPLIVAVSKEPRLCIDEGLRVLKGGGIMVIFDKFLLEGLVLGFISKLLNIVTNLLATKITLEFDILVKGLRVNVLKEKRHNIFLRTYMLEKEGN